MPSSFYQSGNLTTRQAKQPSTPSAQLPLDILPPASDIPNVSASHNRLPIDSGNSRTAALQPPSHGSIPLAPFEPSLAPTTADSIADTKSDSQRTIGFWTGEPGNLHTADPHPPSRGSVPSAAFEPQLSPSKANWIIHRETDFDVLLDFWARQNAHRHTAGPRSPESDFEGTVDFGNRRNDNVDAGSQSPSHSSIHSATSEPQLPAAKPKLTTNGDYDFGKTLDRGLKNLPGKSRSERTIAGGIASDQDKIQKDEKRLQGLKHRPGHVEPHEAVLKAFSANYIERLLAHTHHQQLRESDSVASVSYLQNAHQAPALPLLRTSTQPNIASTRQVAIHPMSQLSDLNLLPNRMKQIFSPAEQIHRQADSMAISLETGNPIFLNKAMGKHIENSMQRPREEMSSVTPGTLRGITTVKSGISRLIAQSSPVGEQVFMQKPRVQLLVVMISKVWNTKPIQHVVSIAGGHPQIHVYLQPEVYNRILAWFGQIAHLRRQSGKGVKVLQRNSATGLKFPSKQLASLHISSDQHFKQLGKDLVPAHPANSPNTIPEASKPIIGLSITPLKEIAPLRLPSQSSATLISHVNAKPAVRTISVRNHLAVTKIYLDPEMRTRMSAFLKQPSQRETGKSAKNAFTNSATSQNLLSKQLAPNGKSSPVGPSDIPQPAHTPMVLKGQRPTTAETDQTGQHSYRLLQINPIPALFKTVSDLSGAPSKVVSNLLRGKLRSIPDPPKSPPLYQAQKLTWVDRFKLWSQSTPQVLTNTIFNIRSFMNTVPRARPATNLADSPWPHGRMGLPPLPRTIPLMDGFKNAIYRTTRSLSHMKPSAEKQTHVAVPTPHSIAELPTTGKYLEKPPTAPESVENEVIKSNRDGAHGSSLPPTKVMVHESMSQKDHDNIYTLKPVESEVSTAHVQDIHDSQPLHAVDDGKHTEDLDQLDGFDAPQKYTMGARKNNPNRMSRFVPKWLIRLKGTLAKFFANFKK